MPIGGRYYIRLANGQTLEAEANTFQNNGCRVQLWSLYRGLNQLWDITDAGHGRFYIKNVGAAKALDAHDATVNTNGGKVQLWHFYPGNVNQQWVLQPLGRNRYTVRCAASLSNKVLDVTGGVIDRDGTAIQLWDVLNGANQIWTLERAHDRAIVAENFVDLRPNQTPVRNQVPVPGKDDRGSCTCFGTLAAIEAAYKKAGYGNLDLSEEFATIMYKALYMHPIWSDNIHANYRENQFGGTQGGGSLQWFPTGFKVPLESDVPYRSINYVPPNWDTLSQIETNAFNNTLFTRNVIKAPAYYGARDIVVLTAAQLHDPSAYERILSLGYEISIHKDGHNTLLVGFDKRNPLDKRLFIKDSYGPNGGDCTIHCGTQPYSEINDIALAEYVLEVTPPSPFPELAFLGSWRMSVDGSLGTLTVYHIPGIGNLETDLDLRYTGRRIQEKRIGIYIDYLGRIFRVNGTITGNTIEMYIDPVKQNLEWTELIGRHYSYVLTPATDVMTGVLVEPSGVRRPQPNITR